MITNLHIKNIGIIDDLEINLNKGMNVLTGETGAGKTLIIDSINIICGGRFSKEMIRKGESYSYVELCMYVPRDINAVDGNIIITREIYNNGRNMCKINGRLVTVAELKDFMSNYIEIHGQNANQQLLDNRTHIKYLDNFSGEKIIKLKEEYKEKYTRYNEIKRELRNNYGDEKEKQRKLDLLKYQLNEIQEISRDVNSSLEDINFDEQEREEVETRLDTIDNLKRKYGNNIEEILKYAYEIEEEIKKIENVDEYNNKLKEEQKNIEQKMTQIAEKIDEIRKEKAKDLSEKINQELIDLEMKNAKINVKVEYKVNEFYEDGKNQVEIFIKTNVGENESELVKIASGGEMSRIMLAIKKVLADVDNMPVMIFDEIDTGISGKTAKSVASKMKSISQKHQVLCISHLAPIAAIADNNYFISKKVENDRTSTGIKLLNEQEVLCEIARISSGDINEVTLKYASELRSKIA